MTTNTLSRYELMRQNNGEPAHPIDEDRFWYLLEVLPPADWTRLRGSETFRVIECETANLYTWCARIGNCFFELIAPIGLTHEEILSRVFADNPELVKD